MKPPAQAPRLVAAVDGGQSSTLALVATLAVAAAVPVIAEGRYSTPAEAGQALDAGALAVVVGSMITRPGHIAGYFIRGMSARRRAEAP